MANVHQQINSTIAKLLVGGPNKQWKLITFDVPNRDCTVSDLLKEVMEYQMILDDFYYNVALFLQACITFMRWNDKLQLVSDSSNVGVNYILYMKGLADVEDYLQSSDEDEEAER